MLAGSQVASSRPKGYGDFAENGALHPPGEEADLRQLLVVQRPQLNC
jgi:hypothetical protein